MCYNSAMAKGKLYVISGPSGAGKGTICKKILEADSNIRFSVSMTTRSPREGETEGKDYFFVNKEEFLELLENAGLLEHNNYVGNYYGTPKQQVVEWIEEGHDVLLEIDYHGAFQVRESYPEAVLIFIMPPSIEDLKMRIAGRGTETESVMAERLKEALNDMAQADKYDYKVINDDIETAVAKVQRIMKTEKSKEA